MSAEQRENTGDTPEAQPEDPRARRADGMPRGIPFRPGEGVDPRINRRGRQGLLTRCLEEEIEALVQIAGKDGQAPEARTAASWIAKVAVTRAMKGDFKYFKEIVHLLDGPPVRRISVQTEAPSLAALDDDQFQALAAAWMEERRKAQHLLEESEEEA